MNQPGSIQIIYEDTQLEGADGEKGLFSARVAQVRSVGELEVEHLAEKLRSFCATIGQAFQGATTTIQDFELQSFELNVDVTAKGEVRLIGALSTEFSGGLKLTFERK